jgi:GNAT superfamily N-acetyltransferase
VTQPQTTFAIRPITDRKFLEELLQLRWSGGSVLLRGKLIAPADVEALAAYDGDRLAGVATWRLEGKVLYLVTLNNITDQRGVGVALLDAMMKHGRERGAGLMRAIVTNDNLNALGFYQRRGFKIIAVYPGAVDTIRSLNPSIPAIGSYRIPMRDEIELELDL